MNRTEINESEKSNFTWLALKKRKVDSENRVFNPEWKDLDVNPSHGQFKTSMFHVFRDRDD